MFLKQEGPSLQRCRACTGFEKGENNLQGDGEE